MVDPGVRGSESLLTPAFTWKSLEAPFPLERVTVPGAVANTATHIASVIYKAHFSFMMNMYSIVKILTVSELVGLPTGSPELALVVVGRAQAYKAS